MTGNFVTAETCPRCETSRVGSFRFCRTCGLDFDAAADGPELIAARDPAGSPGVRESAPVAAAVTVGAPAASDRDRRLPSLGTAPVLLIGACLVAALTMVTVDLALPGAIRIVLAILIIFALPGFAMVCAVLPARLAFGEQLLASLGLSLAIATVVGILLAAAPIGLSRSSFGVTLGGITIMLSAVGLIRARRGPRRGGPGSRQGETDGVRS